MTGPVKDGARKGFEREV